MATDFATLAARAEKRVSRKKSRKPYVLTGLPDEQPDITIQYPDAIKSMEFEKAPNVYEQLRVLTGKDFARVLGLVDGLDIAVVQDLIQSMWDHWDDDSHEVPGGKEG